jgi:hypothetical protein
MGDSTIMVSQWWYKASGGDVGPISSAELLDLAQHDILKQDTPVRNTPDGTWGPAERINGLFNKPNIIPPPIQVRVSAQNRSQSAAEDESSGLGTATKIMLGVCGTICMLIIGFLVWSIATRDTWELDNTARISAELEEADRLKQSDFLTAYKTYDEVLKEAKRHKITSELFAQKIADAEKSKTALYPKVQKKIKADEAEQRRLAEEESRHATEEKQRIAQEKEHQRVAEEKKREEEKRLKDAIAEYHNVPQSARNALNAVKKLEARTEVGVSYQEYSTVVGEAWGDIKVFAESSEGKKLPEFSFLLVSAMGKYKLALDIWQDKVQRYVQYYPTPLLSGVLQQQCWGAANRRIDVAELLITGEDIAAALLKVLRIQKTDAKYEATVRSIQADLITLSHEMSDTKVHTTEREEKETVLFSKRMDDIDKEDKQGP